MVNPWHWQTTGVMHKLVVSKASGKDYDAYLHFSPLDGDYDLVVSAYNIWTGERIMHEERIADGARLKTHANDALRKAGFVPYRAKG